MCRKVALVVSIILALFVQTANSQAINEDRLDSIIEEGRLLYALELSSWYSTDILLENEELLSSIGGYTSYKNEEGGFSAIYFSNKDADEILLTVRFPAIPTLESSTIGKSPRKVTSYEKELLDLRNTALAEIRSDTTGFFSTYQNSNLNLIPLIKSDSKDVIILTGPQSNGVVIFGNDYRLTYTKDLKLKTKQKLHNDILVFQVAEGQESSFHSHKSPTSNIITSTDICTLLLYGSFTPWDAHYVISDEFVSIWSVTDNELVNTITREVWDKISDQTK